MGKKVSIIKNWDHYKQLAIRFVNEAPEDVPVTSLQHIVDRIYVQRGDFLRVAECSDEPLYIYDSKQLALNVSAFENAFKKRLNKFSAYYAFKLNHYDGLISDVIKQGWGLDVASRRELDIALRLGAQKIVYYSPGRNADDLKYALAFAKNVRINLDSFGELKMLSSVLGGQSGTVKIGIRVHMEHHGSWKKYGIPLAELRSFVSAAQEYGITCVGIHFHTSRNKDSQSYIQSIKALALYLHENFSERERSQLEYIDFGGGFEQHAAEGVYAFKTLHGAQYKTLCDHYGEYAEFSIPYFAQTSQTIDEYADDICSAIEEYLNPLVDVEYFSEPGRSICNDVMHIMLRVVDVKDSENIIVNGGVNMVGWQRFEHEYFPLVNISNYRSKEVSVNVWGNLCTTWDIWGYAMYSAAPKEGDLIIVPNQGALTYSLAQNFIHAIPEVKHL